MGLLTVVYLVVGVIVAASHHYFQHADTLKPILSALLAVVLWPLLLLGINLHIKSPGGHRGLDTYSWPWRRRNPASGEERLMSRHHAVAAIR